jgi:hypothetical protein
MKKQILVRIFALILPALTILSCSNSKSGSSQGFEDGHKLKGRYVNTDQGIRSYTFQTNGSFEKGGANSGEFHGGDYVTGSQNAGTYQLNGKTLKLSFENGATQEVPIEIFKLNGEKPDYNLESPAQIRINNVLYVNVD